MAAVKHSAPSHLDGKLLADVEVVFMPEASKGTTGRRSVAVTNKEGHYRIVGDSGKEGAPVGFHRVIVNDMLASKLGSAPTAVGPDDAKGGAVGMKAPTPSAPARRSRGSPKTTPTCSKRR